MGNILKVGVSWTPQVIDKTLKTKFSVGVGGLPTQIKITRMPYKLDYKDGESINPAGMIVHAYYEDGTDFGMLLNESLTLEPSVANSNSQGGEEHKTGTYHIFTEPTLVYISNRPFGDAPIRLWLQGSADMRFVFKNTLISFISKDLNAWAKVGITSQDGVIPNMDYWGSKIIEYSGMQYAVCSSPNGWGFYNPDTYYVGELPSDAQIGMYDGYDDLVKYTYGGSAVPEGTVITVKWNRPVDGMELTTTYNINITGDA